QGSRPTKVLELGLEHALWLATRSTALASLAERARGERRYVREHDFALDDPESRPSAATTLVLPRIADDGAAAVRRSHLEQLLEALPDLVVPAFASLPDGASPFVFPVGVDDKPGLLRQLARERIRALNIWSEPHPHLAAKDFPAAATLRERVVGLPVHQELR